MVGKAPDTVNEAYVTGTLLSDALDSLTASHCAP